MPLFFLLYRTALTINTCSNFLFLHFKFKPVMLFYSIISFSLKPVKKCVVELRSLMHFWYYYQTKITSLGASINLFKNFMTLLPNNRKFIFRSSISFLSIYTESLSLRPAVQHRDVTLPYSSYKCNNAVWSLFSLLFVKTEIIYSLWTSLLSDGQFWIWYNKLSGRQKGRLKKK